MCGARRAGAKRRSRKAALRVGKAAGAPLFRTASTRRAHHGAPGGHGGSALHHICNASAAFAYPAIAAITTLEALKGARLDSN
jgi:hypothetical protein